MSGYRLEIKRVIAAPIDRVFRAWTDPDELRRWHCPDGLVVDDALSDPQPGGAYRIKMLNPEDGQLHIAVGTYSKVEPPTRLTFSWTWEVGGGGATDSQVTVLLKSLDPGLTEVTLIHERLPSDQSRRMHLAGWDCTLRKLRALFEPPAS